MKSARVVVIASAAFFGVAIVVWTLTNLPVSNHPDDARSYHHAGDTDIGSRPTSKNPIAETIQKPSTIRFVDVASNSGITFRYFGSPSPEHFMTEQNGGGIAILDFDADGVVDLFFSNGSHFNSPVASHQVSNELYRATTTLKYESVTEKAGLVFQGIGQGTAAADYDNDGFMDLFVSYFGQNQLWKNNGDGTFLNITETAGVGDERECVRMCWDCRSCICRARPTLPQYAVANSLVNDRCQGRFCPSPPNQDSTTSNKFRG